MLYNKYEIIIWLKEPGNIRYMIIDNTTGEIMCDANGHGYKSEESAYKAMQYKVSYPRLKHLGLQKAPAD